MDNRTDAAPVRVARSRAQLIVALIGLALFATFALVVARNPEHPFTQGLDDAWRRLVGTGPGPENAPFPMFFQHLGEGMGALVLMVIIPVILFSVRRWRSALFFLAGFVGSTVASQLVKNLVNRPRPAVDATNGLFGPLFQVDHGSLPSGHSVTAGFVVVGIAALVPPARRWMWWVIGSLLAVGMIWQRTFINAHWFSDAVIGIVAGAAVTALIWWLFAPLLAKDSGKPLRRQRAAASEGEIS
ncbi:phosphatase PAP2 family protein [Leifsonia sp. A12D58]|uniref:phosphatase PAP2 family protein n=1 Tax=Leifsonia sp. A12D58 TaxID=3397674 RepID=UPI0039E14657